MKSQYLGHFPKVWKTWVHILHLLELDHVWMIKFSSPVKAEDFQVSSNLFFEIIDLHIYKNKWVKTRQQIYPYLRK